MNNQEAFEEWKTDFDSDNDRNPTGHEIWKGSRKAALLEAAEYFRESLIGGMKPSVIFWHLMKLADEEIK